MGTGTNFEYYSIKNVKKLKEIEMEWERSL